MPLEDLVQYVPLPLDEKREYHTIAGLLMEYLQRIPKPGEEVQVGIICLKRCRWKAIACRRCKLFRCVRMARWSTRCDKTSNVQVQTAHLIYTKFSII